MREKFVKSVALLTFAVLVFSLTMGIVMRNAFSTEADATVNPSLTTQKNKYLGPAIVLGVSFCIGASCIGAGYAVGRVGSAALGAISEQPELFTRVLLFVALAEGIAIYGLVVAVMLLRKL